MKLSGGVVDLIEDACCSSLGRCDEEAIAERSQSITDQWKKLVELSQKQKSTLQASPKTISNLKTITLCVSLSLVFCFVSFPLLGLRLTDS